MELDTEVLKNLFKIYRIYKIGNLVEKLKGGFITSDFQAIYAQIW